MAKENKSAESYAKNGTGAGQMKSVSSREFSNKKSAYEVDAKDPAMTVSIGYNDKVNPYGTGTMRGYGAATKGRKISGKMG